MQVHCHRFVAIWCICCAVVYWSSVLHNFNQQSQNLRSLVAQIVLTLCQISGVVGTNDNGPVRNKGYRTFTEQPFHEIICNYHNQS